MTLYIDSDWSELRDLTENDLWSVKYQPKTLDQLLGPWGENKATFDVSANIVLTGPPGIGKTSAARCIATEHLGDLLCHNYLEINFRTARHIDQILAEIHNFAHIQSTVERRFVFIDEINRANLFEQSLIRRYMAKLGESMCFILAGQLKGLTSSVMLNASLIFMKLSDSQILQKLIKICENENVHFDEIGLKAILPIAKGDLRMAINYMQESVVGFGCLTGDKFLKLHPTIMTKMFNFLLKGQYIIATGILYKLLDAKHDVEEILDHFYHTVTQFPIEQSAKIQFVRKYNFMKYQMPSDTLDTAGILHLMIYFIRLVNPNAYINLF